MTAQDAPLRELEAENAKLKRMYADLALESARQEEFVDKVRAQMASASPS